MALSFNIAALWVALFLLSTATAHGIHVEDRIRSSSTTNVMTMMDRQQPPRSLQAFTPPYISLVLHQSLLMKFAEDVRPLLVALAKNISLPGNTTKNFSYKNITLSEFDVGQINVTLESPHSIFLGFTNVTLAVPETDFSIYDTILGKKIGCDGDFSATSSGTNMILEIVLAKNETSKGSEIKTVTPVVQFGSIDITHKLDGTICNDLDKLIEDLIGNLNVVAENLIKKVLPSQMSALIYQYGNELFSKLPIVVPEAPFVVNNSFLVMTDIFMDNPSGPQPSIVPVTYNQFPPRDLEVFVPASAINDFLSLGDLFGFFNISDVIPRYQLNTSSTSGFFPTIYEECPVCPFELQISSPVIPKVLFEQATNGTIAVNVGELLLKLNAINPEADNKTFFILSLAVNTTLEVINLRTAADPTNASLTLLLFEIAIPHFDIRVEQSNVGPVDFSIVNQMINFILQKEFIPAFNKDFKGLPLAPIGGLSMSEILLKVDNSQLAIAGNVQL